MGARREARIAVLMALYAREMGYKGDLASLEERIFEFQPVPEAAKLFFYALYEETVAHIEDIDKYIVERAQNWAMDRIAIVDKNILRLGIAELIFFPDIPPKTTINECIELAKKFGSSESARFVNGLLDGILRHSGSEKAKQLGTPDEDGGN